MLDVAALKRLPDIRDISRLFRHEYDKQPSVFIEEDMFLMSQGTSAVEDVDLRQLEAAFLDFQKTMLRILAHEHEFPEVFELHPLSSKRISLKVRQIEPAHFSFVSDNGDED